MQIGIARHVRAEEACHILTELHAQLQLPDRLQDSQDASAQVAEAPAEVPPSNLSSGATRRHEKRVPENPRSDSPEAFGAFPELPVASGQWNGPYTHPLATAVMWRHARRREG